MTPTVQDTPVLVVGGGLVGLTTALFLQHHGTPFILIERERMASPLPRARGWAVRSLELFRQLGLQDAIEEAAEKAWEQGVFGGARRGATLLSSDALPIPEVRVLTGDDPSPCKMVACPQTAVEPILRRALEERGGDVRFGCELVGFEQDSSGVQARIKDAGGVEQTVHASFLVAADGSRGPVRRDLQIGRKGGGAARHYLNVFFQADLAERVQGRTFSQCEVANERVQGLFLSMNNTTKWSFHLIYNPEVEDPDGWSEAELVARLRAAIGDDVELAVRHRGTWTAADRVAERYREGRVFLVGDAAHIMPPWGGLNGNTGLADAHNLAWRLALAAQGEAAPDLLDGYEGDRRPVAVRNAAQAQLRSDYELRFGICTDANSEAYGRLRDGGELLMRYRYDAGDTVEALRAQVGTRFPHAWIDMGGERRSTLDLFGGAVTSVCGPTALAEDALRAGVDFRFADNGVDWRTLVDGEDDLVIGVGPDGFVASRERGDAASAMPVVR